MPYLQFVCAHFLKNTHIAINFQKKKRIPKRRVLVKQCAQEAKSAWFPILCKFKTEGFIQRTFIYLIFFSNSKMYIYTSLIYIFLKINNEYRLYWFSPVLNSNIQSIIIVPTLVSNELVNYIAYQNNFMDNINLLLRKINFQMPQMNVLN